MRLVPGLVVMGGDSCSKGHGFESRCRILDGHNIFSHTFVVRIVMFAWKVENKQKGGFLKNDFWVEEKPYIIQRDLLNCSTTFGLNFCYFKEKWLKKFTIPNGNSLGLFSRHYLQLRVNKCFLRAAPGSSPKHTIYAFINCVMRNRRK